MRQASSVEVQKNFGAYREIAENEPVFVQHYNKPSVVILSDEEYRRLKARDKIVAATEDLPEWLADKVASTEVSAEHAWMDGEIPDGELEAMTVIRGQ